MARQARRLVVLTVSLGHSRDLLAGASAQRLQLFQGEILSHEACRAIREDEIDPARVVTAKGAESIIQLNCFGRRLVVDLRGGVQRDVGHGAATACDEAPLSQIGYGTFSGRNIGLAEIEFGIVMESLAEQQCVTAAVGDV